MLADELNHWKQLEVDSRKPLSECAHPDDCPKLTIKGVAWAIPACGGQVVPTFTDGAVEVSAVAGDEWPEADRLVELMTLNGADPCPECGQSLSTSLEIDLDTNIEFIQTAFALAAKLLDKQYNLTDEQKGSLLAFAPSALPQWVVDLMLWASGQNGGPG